MDRAGAIDAGKASRISISLITPPCACAASASLKVRECVREDKIQRIHAAEKLVLENVSKNILNSIRRDGQITQK